MPDTFAVTIIFVVICTVTGAFIKGRMKDRCLTDLSDYFATLEEKNGKTVWGRLRVENSGMEFVYAEPYLDKADGHTETSYVLYKKEFDRIKVIVRYVDSLDPDLEKKRGEDLARTRHPGWWRRSVRKVRNFFGTVRDSLMEIVNLFIGKAKAASPGAFLAGQDKHTSMLEEQLISATGTSYEPILERYIGKKVVLAVMVDGAETEYAGVLKDYTAEFLEIMDAQYGPAGGTGRRAADLVIPRALGTVRHLGE